MARSMMEKIKGKLGYKHVPDNMVQVIFRDGRYHRAEGNTFIRRRVHDETYGPQIKVGVRVVETLYQNIASRDGVLHNIKVHVKVFFDLRLADPQVAPLLVENCETILQGKVKGLVDLALRREIAQADATRLLQPDAAIRLEEAIKERLERNLGFFGASLLAFEDALIVKEILPPERMHETRVEATNISETADSLADLHHAGAGDGPYRRRVVRGIEKSGRQDVEAPCGEGQRARRASCGMISGGIHALRRPLTGSARKRRA